MIADFNGWHLLVLVVSLVLTVGLPVLALVMLWRDKSRTLTGQVVWTVVIVVLNLLGAIGFFINWSLGKAADRLNRGPAS